VADPSILRLLVRLDAAVAAVAQVDEAIGDPFHVLLDRDDHVRQHGGAAGARDREQVGKAGDAEAEIGAGAGAPLVAQLLAAPAADVDLQQRARHGIEARGEDDAVECVFLAADDQPSRRQPLDPLLADVDQMHVRPIERFEVVRIETQTLAADHVLGGEQLGDCGIADDLTYSLPHERGRFLVGIAVGAEIAVSPQ